MAHKSLHNTNPCKTFPHNGIYLIQLFLHQLEFWNCHTQNQINCNGKQNHHNQEHARNFCVYGKCHDDTADTKQGRTHQHPQTNHNHQLNLCDVICQTGNQRRRGKGINIMERKFLYLFKCRTPKVCPRSLTNQCCAD